MTNRNPILFGTDGWRGLIDRQLTSHNVSLAARAFADYILERESSPKAAIGYDNRRRSREFAEIFAEVLSGAGVRAFLSNQIIPTPALSYAVAAREFSAGAMITASHNPPEYNGVKFKASYGGPFLTEETRKVEERVGATTIRRDTRLVKEVDFRMHYLKRLEQLVDFGSFPDGRVLVDSMGGAGGRIIEEVLERQGFSAHTIFGEPREDFYGRAAEPIEKNLAPLAENLRSDKSIVGLATDGDADRLGVLRENGEWLSAQETILFLADYVVNERKEPGALVKTASVTDRLRERFEREGRQVVDAQVGFKYVCEEMLARETAFGCEESGGYGFGAHVPERDGPLSALHFLAAMGAAGARNVSELLEQKRAEMGEVFYDRVDHSYDGDDRATLLPSVADNPPERVGDYVVERVDKYLDSRGGINGAKFTLEGGARWLLVRVSETEPLVRFYAEGRERDEPKRLLDAGFETLKIKRSDR